MDQNVIVKSARNIPGVVTTTANILSVYDILNAKYLVVDKAALAISRRCTHNGYRLRYHHPPHHHRAVHGGAADKKYVFEVAKDASKIEIKKAVEEIFGVKVAKVNTLNMPGKGQAHGRRPSRHHRPGRRPYVTLTADSKTIEFFEGMV